MLSGPQIIPINDFSSVIRSFIEKNSKSELKKAEIDKHFSSILNKISFDFHRSLTTEDFSPLFEYISKSVSSEIELHKRYDFEKMRKFSSTNIYILGQLIAKTNFIHTRIVSMVVDEIFLFYSDYAEVRRAKDFLVADELKISAVKIASQFILFLTENRTIDETIFDRYITLISQALNIFR